MVINYSTICGKKFRERISIELIRACLVELHLILILYES
jgi:hypothetical protein